MSTVLYGPRMELDLIPIDKNWYPVKLTYCKICGKEIPSSEFDCPMCEWNSELLTALNRLRLM
jgi:hypothetical protein